MSKLTIITDRALELVSQAGGHLRNAAGSARHTAEDQLRQANQGLRQLGSGADGNWLNTGAAMSAVKTGGKIAGKFVKRNPVVTVAATMAGLGLIGYALYRKRKRKQDVLHDDAARLEYLHTGNAPTHHKTTRRRGSTTPTDQTPC